MFNKHSIKQPFGKRSYPDRNHGIAENNNEQTARYQNTTNMSKWELAKNQ